MKNNKLSHRMSLYPKGTFWLKCYFYIMMPATSAGAAAAAYRYLNEEEGAGGYLVLAVFQLAHLGMLAAAFFLLFRGSASAYRTNMTCLAAQPILAVAQLALVAPAGQLLSAEGLRIVALPLLYTGVNTYYFRRRRPLFGTDAEFSRFLREKSAETPLVPMRNQRSEDREQKTDPPCGPDPAGSGGDA